MVFDGGLVSGFALPVVALHNARLQERYKAGFI